MYMRVCKYVQWLILTVLPWWNNKKCEQNVGKEDQGGFRTLYTVEKLPYIFMYNIIM